MCSVLQCVAVCCRVVQCIAKCCMCVAMCCSGVAVCCSELQCAAVHSSALHRAHKHHDTSHIQGLCSTDQPLARRGVCVYVREREKEGERARKREGERDKEREA